MGFGAGLVDRYAWALSHPSPHVREQAALGLQYCKEAGLPALLPLLAEPEEVVRQRAVWAMAELGEGTLPEPRRIRAAGPGRLRAGAAGITVAW
ncbi:HEAT repeat domain-containing protein [Catellatospora sp. NPDC049133]|uniref:HEAT repeat domain-containing protein n=1 Tax=Catellatospora sp. NPDC049133 TaxID=3155499 RepID=UPI0033FC0B41